jgi:hypothetical protein
MKWLEWVGEKNSGYKASVRKSLVQEITSYLCTGGRMVLDWTMYGGVYSELNRPKIGFSGGVCGLCMSRVIS